MFLNPNLKRKLINYKGNRRTLKLQGYKDAIQEISLLVDQKSGENTST